MKMYKSAGNFAKIGVDINDKDTLEIATPGEMVQGKFGEQAVFGLKTKNGIKNVSFNKVSTNNLVEGFGDETENWVGKRITAFLVRAMVQGEMKNIAYYAPLGFVMTDSGAFISPKRNPNPTIDIQEDTNVDDVPF
jgi:hypothetical protein